ncbi:MAG: PQQ-binding-like beta-propeller repeat protein, partial [Microlunatus sp.]|nr:PQQ-binding-like beta-propeller repeat protein [Microlunatus sp.]
TASGPPMSATARPTAALSPSASPSHRRTQPPAPWLAPVGPKVKGHLRKGSDPSVLPSDLLIADKLNNRLIIVDRHGRIRWQFPRHGDLAHGQTFRIPDDAFFSPDGRSIIATQEDDAVISVIDIATHRIVYRYGRPGHPGHRADRLSNPDDAMLLPDRSILVADIKNCRLVRIAHGRHRPEKVIGRTSTACLHQPPRRWGSPNGAFPMHDGHYLVTEINGDWVDEVTLSGKVLWSIHPPQVAYPSDTNEISRNRFLTVDYSTSGQVVIFNRHGRRLWHFSGHGRDALDHPSLALPLPNGDVVLNDDGNHRVIVVDPRTDKIVWQYGVTGVAGHRPGYLDNPDGIDLVPPNSLLVSHASTMGH